jgi:non-ribosomal peptide synthetase component F
MRVISLGSETIYKSDVELFKKFFPDHCTMIARLGSSEISPIRQFFIDKQTEIIGNVVPSGYAVMDNEVLLLDDEGKQVGPEKVGEITVRSSYLSPGYWQRPDITKAAFLADPEGGDGRINRTGDLGLMMPDGCLIQVARIFR